MNSSCAFVILDGFSDVWALPISSCLATRDCYMERIHMDNINQFISNILNIENREKFIGIIDWVQNTFPERILKVKWN